MVLYSKPLVLIAKPPAAVTLPFKVTDVVAMEVTGVPDKATVGASQGTPQYTSTLSK